jgi:hypothetical protein
MEINIEHTSYHFRRKKDQPVTLEEYNFLKADFPLFISTFQNEQKREFKAIENPHAFKWKLFLLLFSIVLVFLTLGTFSMAWEWLMISLLFYIPAIVLVFTMIMQPIQYFSSFMKSNQSFREYLKTANTYYKYHNDLIITSESYDHYLNLMKLS